MLLTKSRCNGFYAGYVKVDLLIGKCICICSVGGNLWITDETVCKICVYICTHTHIFVLPSLHRHNRHTNTFLANMNQSENGRASLKPVYENKWSSKSMCIYIKIQLSV